MESFRQYEPLMNKISPDLNNEYHVFLSFRGPDVRKKFVDHLYESLTASGLRVFLDSEELEKGKAIDASLETAIEKSDILIPIFSQRYAESTWCLEEAVRMRKSEALIIPLFYDVEPSDVRYPRKERGKFKEAFEKHDSRSDRQSGSTIQNWEIALREISGLSGWTSEAESGYEAKLVKRVVKDVLNTLQKNAPLDVAKYPIGLETGIRQLVDLLDLSSTNRKVKVGIIGLGGLGKTTLAKAVYNKIQGGFKASCFLFNIGAAVQNGTTLEDLQRRILKDLVRFEGKVSSVDAGKVLMKDRLRGVPALIILDDVNDTSHLDALDGDWFGPGSRLIIISRDRHMPNLAKVNSIHEMSGLKETEALQLFSCHAFSKTVPENPYKGFSTSIVKACGGIPLALIVMGAHLCDKKDPNDIECWQEAVTNIVKFPGIFTVLRISYDGLSDIEKKIFLDIACCLVGEMINEPVIFWKALHPNEVHTAMKNLSLKMLINTSGVEDRLDMHVLVQQMGRRIQEELSNNSRVWQAPMGAGTHRDLNTDRSERVTMLDYRGENGRESLSLQSMPSLLYLSLQNVVVVDNIRNLAPNLIWIKIRDCEFLSDSRTWRISRNRSQIDSWSQLRIFSLQHCASIKAIPNTLDSLVNLQHLNLEDCPALTTLPKGLGNCLVNLQRLRVRGCSALATLPNTLGNLSRLEVLDLCGCASLTGLPDTVGNLKGLVYLCLGHCTGLKGLPITIGNLSKLKILNLLNCRGLSVLPNTMGNMAELQFLNLLCCSSLQSLPYTLGKLAQLRSLSFQGCPGLGSFGDVVLKLASLRKLNRCTELSNLTQKEINVYLSLTADEEPDPGDRLYESLPSKSLSICRGWDDDVSGEAIFNSDIIVPLLGDHPISETWENRVKAMCASGSLTIPFLNDLPNEDLDLEEEIDAGKVSSVDAGKVLMRDRLRGVPALIILDDVNDTSHLDALDGDWFGPGSRLIIISRDRHMPNLAKVNSIHEMSGLKETEALLLFSCHAFSKTVPENPYKGFSTSIVKACGGIPLALIVMGAHLCDKKDPNDIECWQEAVTNIVKFPGIFTVLRISYDGLTDIEKKIFLDIACFLVGEMKNEAVIFHKALHPNEVHTAMKNLSLKMLINTSGVKDRLDMHALVQQMGRRIQEDLSNNSRVWQAPMGAGTHRDLNTDRSERVTMLFYRGENGRESFSLQSMPSLQYLSLQNVVVVDNIRNLAPNLIWIKIRDCEFLSDSCTWRILRNRLQIDSWSQLRIFSLQHCASIRTIPNTLDSLVNLQRLSLEYCPALTTLPKGLGNCLVNLQRLRVRHCSALATLPNTLGNLSRLEVLDLCGCASLTGLPDTVGNLKRLVYLCLGNCTGLKGLPRTIGNLSKLKFLNLLRCRGLSVLPDTMGNMAELQFLNLLCCSSLQSLPYTLGKLAQLRLLSIQGCPGLGSFGDVVLKLASLRKLNRCTGLSNLTQKEINVYLSLPADEEPDPGDRLYESLPSRSLSICRAWDDDVSGEAISNSDIIVPLLGDNHISETWENRVKAMCASGSLTIPFFYDLKSEDFDSEAIDHDGMSEYWDIQMKSIPGSMVYKIFYE